MLSIPELIKKKKDGGALSDEDIKTFIRTVTNKTIQEAQIGAMLMAIWQKGMMDTEIETLTWEMMSSGEVMSWPKEWAGLVVDKHSTGGVGDKVSLVLAPALAACGCRENENFAVPAGGLLLLMTGLVSDLSEGRRQISDAVIGGAALSKFQAMMEAQGVANETARSLCSAHTDYYSILRKAKHQIQLETPAEGVVLDVDGLVLAEVLHKLGAGRCKAGEAVNHSVGAELLVSLGQRVKKGVSWLRVHHEDPAPTPDQISRLQSALTLGAHEHTQTQEKPTLVEELLLPHQHTS